MKTKINPKSVAFFFLLIPCLLFAQQKDSVNSEIQVFKIDQPFSKIRTSGSFTLVIQQAADPVISFDKSMAENIQFKVKDDRITVISTGSSGSKKSIVLLRLKDVSAIQSDDVSAIETKGELKCSSLNLIANDVSKQRLVVDIENLIVNSNDASNISLQGKALNVTLVASDASKTDARFLEAVNVGATTNDAAHAWVNAKETMNGVTNDVSQLSYNASAKMVNIDSKDVSRVKKMDNIEEVVVETTEAQIEGAPDLQSDSIGQLITDILVQVDSNLVKPDSAKVRSKWFNGFHRKKRFDGNWGGLMIGFNNFMNASNELDVPVGYEFLDLELVQSRTYALNLFEYNIPLVCNKLGITTGLGFQWYNYRFSDNAVLLANKSMIDGGLDTINAAKYQKSRLSYTMLNIPLLLEYQTNPNHNRKSFHVNAGVILGIKLGAHTKTILEDGSKTYVKVYDDFNLSPVRLDATAGIGYGKINLFASYALNTLFKEKEGPSLYPATAGIYLLLW